MTLMRRKTTALPRGRTGTGGFSTRVHRKARCSPVNVRACRDLPSGINGGAELVTTLNTEAQKSCSRISPLLATAEKDGIRTGLGARARPLSVVVSFVMTRAGAVAIIADAAIHNSGTETPSAAKQLATRGLHVRPTRASLKSWSGYAEV